MIGIGLIFQHTTSILVVHDLTHGSYALFITSRGKKMIASSFSDPTPPWSLSTHQKAENTTSNHVPSSTDAAFWHVAACARTHELVCIDQDSISPVPVDRPPWPDV